jgi:hypothetical protein
MKNIGKFAVLGAVLTASASFASAASIQIGSYATFTCSGANAANCTTPAATVPTGDVNTSTTDLGFVAFPFGNGPTWTNPSGTIAPSTGAPAATYTLLPASPTWAAALANSTWVGGSANAGPGGTNPAQGFYTFQTTFTDTGVFSGLLNVMADDSTEVFLNGSLIIPFGSFGSDFHCADNLPTCSAEDSVLISSVSGLNTLTFVVEQAGDFAAVGTDPSGVDFDATLTATPEPSSLMLLGSGLVGAAGLFFRRRSQTV